MSFFPLLFLTKVVQTLLLLLLTPSVLPYDITFRKAKLSDLSSVAKICTEKDKIDSCSSSSSSGKQESNNNNEKENIDRLRELLEYRMTNYVEKGAKHLMLVAVDSTQQQQLHQREQEKQEDQNKKQTICGFAEMGMMPLPVTTAIFSEKSVEYPYLANVAIRKEYRRQGLGSKLVKLAYKIAIDKWKDDALFLSVNTDNTKAIQMYQKLHFDILLDTNTVTTTNTINKQKTSSSLFLQSVWGQLGGIRSSNNNQEEDDGDDDDGNNNVVVKKKRKGRIRDRMYFIKGKRQS